MVYLPIYRAGTSSPRSQSPRDHILWMLPNSSRNWSAATWGDAQGWDMPTRTRSLKNWPEGPNHPATLTNRQTDGNPEKQIDEPHSFRQNSCGHSPLSLLPVSSLPEVWKRFLIISSTSESLTLKTSARISLAIWSSNAFGFIRKIQCTTALFCGLNSWSRTPAIVCLYYV